MAANRRWIGGAAARSQVNTFVFAGSPWVVGDVITIVYGSKTWTYSITSATIATFLPLLVTAYTALVDADYPEYTEQTASSTSPNFVLTADEAGKPFLVTISTNSVAGTIDGAASSAGVATVVSSGPNDWSTAANWSAATLPVSTDTVICDLGEYPILYGLSQPAAVNLAAAKFLVQDQGWTIGLPEINRDGTPYPEYRTTYLTVGTITALTVRTASGRVKLNVGSTLCTANVTQTGNGAEQGIEALLLLGTNAANVVNVSGQSEVGIAVLGSEVATVVTLRVEESARVRCGSGATLTTVEVDGGTVETNSAITTLTQRAGEVTHRASTLGTANLTDGATLAYQSNGTITALNVGSNSTVDFDTDPQPRTVTAADAWAGATIMAENGTVTWTAGIDLNRCALDDVTLRLPRDIKVSIGATT